MAGYDPKEVKIESDYDTTRENLLTILNKGQEALNHALEIAKQSEHPRAFEVLSNMMKNMADINDKLMALNKQKKEIDRVDEPKQIAGTTNNNLFIGSTTELQRFLQNEKVIDAEQSSE